MRKKSKLLGALLLLAAAVTFGAIGAEGQVPNIYGTSLQMKTGLAVDQQFASLYVAEPRDVLIQLGDGDTPVQVRWEVAYGSGGTSRVTSVVNGILGTVMHVVANTVTVRGTLAASSVQAGGRVLATVGYGVPTEAIARQYAGAIDPAGFIDLPMPAFCSGVAVRGENAALTVQPRLRIGAGNNSVGAALAVAEYARVGPFNPLANTCRISNPGGSAYRYEVTFYATT